MGERKKEKEDSLSSRVHTCGMKEKTIEEGRKGKRERGMVVFVCLYGRKKRKGAGLFCLSFSHESGFASQTRPPAWLDGEWVWSQGRICFVGTTALRCVHTVQINGGNIRALSNFKYHTFLFHDFSFLHFATWNSSPDGGDVVDEHVGEKTGPRSAAACAGDHLALGAGAGAVVPAPLQHRGEGWNKKKKLIGGIGASVMQLNLLTPLGVAGEFGILLGH